LRLIDTSAPAAAGAALVAAVSLGHYRDLADGSAHWVEPRLSQVRAVGRDLDSSCVLASPAPASA
jgi:hypothetical protein